MIISKPNISEPNPYTTTQEILEKKLKQAFSHLLMLVAVKINPVEIVSSAH